MAITFIGASHSSGFGIHASLPAHQAGDIFIVNTTNGLRTAFPSPPSGWTVLAVSYSGGYHAFAVKTASSSSEVNAGWSDFDRQQLAVYRPSPAALVSYGAAGLAWFESIRTHENLNYLAARPTANRLIIFQSYQSKNPSSNLATGVVARIGSPSDFLSPPPGSTDLTGSSDTLANLSFSSRLSIGGAGASYQAHIDDKANIRRFDLNLSVTTPSSEDEGAVFFLELIDPNFAIACTTGTLSLQSDEASGTALISLRRRADSFFLSANAPVAAFAISTTATGGSFLLIDPPAAVAITAPVTPGVFDISLQAADRVLVYRVDYTRLTTTPAQLNEDTYGGSDKSLPSFLRPYYTRYNSVHKSRDLGEVEILIADFSGQVGSQAGTNTLFFKVTLARELDLRVVKTDTGASTDRLISVGILDSERKPLPMTPAGYGYLNDIHNTFIDESKSRLPAGTYYITVSSNQWQSLPFAFSLFVGSYALLSGNAIGRLIATGRLPLLKPVGQLLGTAPLSATVLNPDFIKNLIPRLDLGGPQAEFLTPGTYNWTAPAGVTSVSAVCIGGGGGGGNAWANAAGSGGGLGWKNNIPVSPGTTYTVVVGGGGLRNSLSAGGNSYFISLSTVAGYGGGNASSGQDTNGPNKNGYGGGWFGDGGGAGGNATNWTGGGGAGGYTGNGGAPGVSGSGGGGGGGLAYSSTYGVGSGGGTGIYGQGDNGLTGRSRDGALWSGSAVSGFGGSGGSTATGINGVTTGTGGLQGQTASYGQPYVNSITGGFPGGGGGGPGTSYGGGNGGGGAVRIMWGGDRVFPASNTADIADSEQTFAGGLASPSLTLTIMRGTALGQMLPSGRLKQTWRITGTVTGSASLEATLSSETPYGSGYGY